MSVISNVFTLTVSLFLPLGIVFWLSAKRKEYLKPILLGALTFFVFQILLRIPLIQLFLPKMQWYIVMNVTSPLLTALLLGVTASLFEEGGRYIVMKYLMKSRQHVSDGIAFGIGHGGLEAILLAGINALFTLVFASMSLSAELMFAGGIERLAAMVCHVAWSVMVLKSIREKKIRWLLYALGLHALIDTAVVWASYMGLSIVVIETVLGIFALFMLGYVLYENKTKGENVI